MSHDGSDCEMKTQPGAHMEDGQGIPEMIKWMMRL